MGTKYSSQSSTGYASSPPSDDGAATEANKVKFSTIRQKLTDVLKTFIEAVNTALVTALDKSARAVTDNDNSAATDHDRTIQVNTASVTITLADATTMAAGYTASVSNRSSGAITVALATATDTIDEITNTTHSIEPKETRRYIVNAAATGYLSSSNRVSLNDLVEDTSPDLGADYLYGFDASTSRIKKTLMGRVGSGVLMTEQTPSSTAVCDFTGIPSWAKQIKVSLVGLSTSGTSALAAQIGDAGDIEATGYASRAAAISTGVTSGSTTHFQLVDASVAASAIHGVVTLTLEDASDNTWVMTSNLSYVGGEVFVASGSKALSATLDRIRLTTTGGSDTFDAGAINILYE